MARSPFIELGDPRSPFRIPILHEDRSVIAIDKPAGWLLVPFNWQSTQRNLQAAITSSISAGDYWAKSRNLRYLRNVHRLDGDTSGVLLLAKSQGALETYSGLFEARKMSKTYLAVVRGIPKEKEWVCQVKLGPDPKQVGRVVVDAKNGKEAETRFRLLRSQGERSLVEAFPLTGRTHQIRVHLCQAGLPIVGDDLYSRPGSATSQSRVGGPPDFPLALRAVELAYFDPFQRKPLQINAPIDPFLSAFGFRPDAV